VGDDVQRLHGRDIGDGRASDIARRQAGLAISALLLVSVTPKYGIIRPSNLAALAHVPASEREGSPVHRQRQAARSAPRSARQKRVEISFANTLCRERNRGRFIGAQHFLHGDGAEGQQRAPMLGDGLEDRILAVLATAIWSRKRNISSRGSS